MKRIQLFSWTLALLACTFSLNAQGFTPVQQAAGIDHYAYLPIQMGGGVAWFDYDADGDEDCYLTGGWAGNKLYRNNGDGTFSDVTAASGIVLPDSAATQAVVTGDVNNDGYREIFITTQWFEPNYFFLNNGDGTFTDISISSGIGLDSVWTSTSAFGDFDLDGDLDLYTGNYVYLGQATFDTITGQPNGYAHRCDGNSLFLNNGDLTFTDVAAQYGVNDTGCALSVVLSDFDNDNDADFLIANDFGEWVWRNSIYTNNYPNGSNEVGMTSNWNEEMYGMGIAVGDYDRDLDFDYYITDIGRNAFLQNSGNGTFTDLADVLGVDNTYQDTVFTTGWGDAFLDYDNDGWLDLVVANGYIQLLPFVQNARHDPNKLWRNNGNGTFTDVSIQEGVADTTEGRGLAYADYDMDGDLDIMIAQLHIDTPSTDRNFLLRNDQNNGNHWLQIRLQGVNNNRDAFGSKVIIHSAGGSQIFEILGGSSHYSQHSSIAHFGLGADSLVDLITVVWPDGMVQHWGPAIAVDTLIHLVEDSTMYVSVEEAPMPIEVRAWPVPFGDQVHLSAVGVTLQTGHWEVLDLHGRLVARSPEQHGSRSDWVWDGRGMNGQPVASGIYLARYHAGATVKTIRIAKI